MKRSGKDSGNVAVISRFESKVAENVRCCFAALGRPLESCVSIGAAVSGGADSVSLLAALKSVLSPEIQIKAVTVNHGMRPPEETCGDADFVEAFCAELGVRCVRYDIARGAVFALARKLKTSAEAAARKIRYEQFYSFMKAENVPFVCLAHTKSDQVETLVMRFLQGSSSLSGIPQVRDSFIRPLLNISRAEVESYLAARGISFRTDSTNFDTSVLRNRIRRTVVPLLDREFPGWQNAVCALAEKSRRSEAAVSALAEEALLQLDVKSSEGQYSFDEKRFRALPEAVRMKIAFEGIAHAGPEARIPYSFAADVFLNGRAGRTAECGGIEVRFLDGRIFIQKKQKIATETGFFVIIETEGIYQAGIMQAEAVSSGGSMTIRVDSAEITLENVRFPFVFRSRQPGDAVRTADGSLRSASKILDDWKAGELRDMIPFIQNISAEKDSPAQEICCIWGSLFGFKDWIVRDLK